MMESTNKVPFCFSGYDALDIRWAVPVPGPTGLIRAVLFAIATVASRMGFRASRLASRGSIAS